MAFKIKDLMINVLSEDAYDNLPPCRTPSRHCVPTFPPGATFIQCFVSFGVLGAVDTDQAQTSPVTPFTALSILKGQLTRQLAEVEKQQAAAEQSMLPETVEEVDELSKKLTEALEELKARRAELSKMSG
jgi:hypothetical protein